jgi:hypothetical protein
VDIDVAKDFPRTSYQAVEKRVAAYVGSLPASASPVPGVSEFFGGWNALILRFRATDEFRAAAIGSLGQGGAPPNDVRYEQERDVFGFYANVLSTVESCSYAIYHLARVAGVSGFDRKPREVTVWATATAVATSLPGSPLDVALHGLISSSAWDDLREVRNILLHRESPARTIYMGTDGATVPPAEWTALGLALDATLVEVPRAWLGTTTQQLVEAAEAFAVASL